MSALGEALRSAGASHARAIGADGQAPQGRQDRALRRIARRRRARTGAIGVAAAVALAAIGLSVVAGVADRQQQAAAALAAAGNPCDLDTYPLPNVAALAGAPYYGRAYVDVSAGTGHYRKADGTLVEVVAGNTPTTDWEPTLWYRVEDGGQAFSLDQYGWMGLLTVDGGEADHLVFDITGMGAVPVYDPADLWTGWTTTLPAVVPVGVSPTEVATMHAWAFMATYASIMSSAAGTDAVIQRIVTHADGTQDEEPMLVGYYIAPLLDTSDVVGITTRITMPSGERYDVVSSRDEGALPRSACGSNDTVWQPLALGTTDSGVYQGPDYLTGPEVDEFQCGAPLDPSFEVPVVSRERRRGVTYEDDLGMQVDYRSGATLVTVEAGYGDYPDFDFDLLPSAPGWDAAYGDAPDGSTGAFRYASVVWVDGLGRIVGSLEPTQDDYPFGTAGFIPGWWYFWQLAGGVGPWEATVYDDAGVVPCDGASQAAVAGASPVVILGEGPSPDAMHWSWFPVHA
ncbi:hypothetical protein RN607_12405 [Demequina capsici]|uniref:Uncharacterized protein n=1 Tax=Demequina capsici TaxID=3075620 RepID=A0AA96FA56_9MICO|nr:hypothetical protein [Demequina sp. PMTSA13]WNM26991.1 hypothetical protein RN607_12405 [Demequina sp. PMTSA13]